VYTPCTNIGEGRKAPQSFPATFTGTCVQDEVHLLPGQRYSEMSENKPFPSEEELRAMRPWQLDELATRLTGVALVQQQSGTDRGGERYRFITLDPKVLEERGPGITADSAPDKEGFYDNDAADLFPHRVWRPGDRRKFSNDGVWASQPRGEAELDTEDRVRAALERLKPEHREVLEATFYEGRTLQQHADRVNITREGVKKRFYKAKAALAKELAA
jgi:RNA polymerase sigma factor (sigma-70 family)